MLTTYWIAVFWPLMNAAWLALAQWVAGMELKAGPGAALLAASVGSLVIGMLMVSARIYEAKRVGKPIIDRQLVLASAAIGALLSGLLLAFIGSDSYCGGGFGDCGRWI